LADGFFILLDGNTLGIIMQAEKLAVNSDISIFDTEPDSSLYQQVTA